MSEIERELKKALAETTTPRKIGDGPAGFALATTPAIQPFRWDSNCFYDRLGLEPGCPRIEIVRAFQESPRKTAEEHLYYATAAKALLKKLKRTLYDALPLGSYYGDDPALIAAINSDEEDGLSFNDEPPTWSYYASEEVSDADVRNYDFGRVRSLLVTALAPWAMQQDEVPYIGLGLTSTETRWVPVGYLPVLMLGVDEEVTEEYASGLAVELQRNTNT